MPERTPSAEEAALRKQIAATGAQLAVHCWGDHGQFWSAEIYRDGELVGDTGTYKSVEPALRNALKLCQKAVKKPGN